MKAYIIRHGEKNTQYSWNDTLAINDNPLNENGVIESLNLCSYLVKVKDAKVYVSEYIRTKDTILPYCEIAKCIPIVTNLLNEIDMGKFKLVQEKNKQEEYFIKWYKYQKRRLDFRYDEGESGRKALKRVKAFFEIISKESNDAIVVTHEGWIKLAICHILGIRAGKRFYFGSIKTCSLMEIEYEEEAKKWRILSINKKSGET
jgi:broad specificity phosphatase PhoE